MVDHLQLCGNKLYLRTDKLLPDFYHGTSAFFTDLFSFIHGMEYLTVGNVFDQFLPLAGILPFTEMLFHFNKDPAREHRDQQRIQSH